MTESSHQTVTLGTDSSIGGYRHRKYAESFSQLGTPRALAASGGWLIERPIPENLARDAMGCYPLFTCHDWGAIGSDLNRLDRELVAVSLVTDPLGEFTEGQLKDSFPDLCRPFKEHFAIDNTLPQPLPAGHRRNVRLSARQVDAERVDDPASRTDEWIALYQNLIQRHCIRGITAFSPESLARQLAVPGLVMFRAVYQHQTVGITLWYVDRNIAYYHLGAYHQLGYNVRASFALFDQALAYFRERLRWVLLGAGAGVSENTADGLTRFKRGWANTTRTAWLCGRTFDHSRYQNLVNNATSESSNYYPAYRAGEFS